MTDPEFLGRLVAAGITILGALGGVMGWSYKYITKPINECTTELKLFNERQNAMKELHERDKKEIEKRIDDLEEDVKRNGKEIQELKKSIGL